jgi:hypothetical protein
MPNDVPPALAAGPADSVAEQAMSPTVANPPAAPPQTQASAAAPTSAQTAAAPRIQLSTAIALAQTLPDGTSVLCSIDYQWVSSGVQTGVQYIWVIELGNGQRMSGPANVSKRSGTVQAILRGVKPDQGPFKGAIFAKSSSPGLAPEPVSDFINLTN